MGFDRSGGYMNARAAPKQRIVMVDALIGFALFGLFIIHMVEYF
ncbi:MAG: putative membrane protein YeiB [Flavobacteriales bacterium]|jgi:uncharacterized membrane protein YeiB